MLNTTIPDSTRFFPTLKITTSVKDNPFYSSKITNGALTELFKPIIDGYLNQQNDKNISIWTQIKSSIESWLKSITN